MTPNYCLGEGTRFAIQLGNTLSVTSGYEDYYFGVCRRGGFETILIHDGPKLRNTGSDKSGPFLSKGTR